MDFAVVKKSKILMTRSKRLAGPAVVRKRHNAAAELVRFQARALTTSTTAMSRLQNGDYVHSGSKNRPVRSRPISNINFIVEAPQKQTSESAGSRCHPPNSRCSMAAMKSSRFVNFF